MFVDGKKACKRCGIKKTESGFYRSAQLKDGFMNACKICYEEERTDRKKKVEKVNSKRTTFPTEKYCIECETTKSTDHFYFDLKEKDGFRSLCKDCNRSHHKEYDDRRRAPKREERKFAEEREKELVGYGKRCTICKEIKSKDEFSNRSDQKDGLNYVCRECEAKAKRKLAEKNKTKNLNKSVDPKQTKTCALCKEIKSVVDFTRHYESSDGFSQYCKPCKKIRKAAYIDQCVAKVKHSIYLPTDPKYCFGCEVYKTRYDFHDCYASPDGLQSRCKQCQNSRANTSTNGSARQRRHRLAEYEPVSEQAIINLLEEYKHLCLYCRIEVKRGINLHIDHRIPICRGGPHMIENLVPSCANCNLRKGKKTDVEFFEQLAKEAAL